jgi:ribonuclease D
MKIRLHKSDLPDGLDLGPVVAVDTETLGLNTGRDRLCLIQLSSGDGSAHLVQFTRDNYLAPNLKHMLADPKVLKLYHFARFDLAVIRRYLGVVAGPVYCTRTASKLARTYTDKHGLKDLVKEFLDVDLSKQQQSSDWGAKDLTEQQLAYAANDVAYLHRLKDGLDGMLKREGRMELAQACFDFLPARAELDVAGWAEGDIFAH